MPQGSLRYDHQQSEKTHWKYIIIAFSFRSWPFISFSKHFYRKRESYRAYQMLVIGHKAVLIIKLRDEVINKCQMMLSVPC